LCWFAAWERGLNYWQYGRNAPRISVCRGTFATRLIKERDDPRNPQLTLRAKQRKQRSVEAFGIESHFSLTFLAPGPLGWGWLVVALRPVIPLPVAQSVASLTANQMV
jgi:hypothetical protein